MRVKHRNPNGEPRNGVAPEAEEVITVTCLSCNTLLYESAPHHRGRSRRASGQYMKVARQIAEAHTASTGHPEVVLGGYLVGVGAE